MGMATDRGQVVSADTRPARRGAAYLLITLLSFVAAQVAQADESRMPVFQTRYYRIHSDLDRELTQDLARRMDGMFDEYKRRLAGFQTDVSAPPMEVYL